MVMLAFEEKVMAFVFEMKVVLEITVGPDMTREVEHLENVSPVITRNRVTIINDD